jgi:hypothetical protein
MQNHGSLRGLQRGVIVQSSLSTPPCSTSLPEEIRTVQQLRVNLSFEDAIQVAFVLVASFVVSHYLQSSPSQSA